MPSLTASADPRPDRPLISVVSPVYRGEAMIAELVARNRAVLEPLCGPGGFEIILVDDCGPDRSWARIREQAALDPRVRGVRLARNFGQHYAITAGLDAARGEWVVVMDCDLQDQPEMIPLLYRAAVEGDGDSSVGGAPYDVVLARRAQRQDDYFKRLFSRLFYRTLSYLSGTRYDPSVANFGIYHRQVVEAIVSMREAIRYFPAQVQWVGFRQRAVDVEHASRAEGTSSYNLRRLLLLALDIILAYSDKPIRLAIRAGIIISLTAIAFSIFTLIRYLAGEIVVPGYTSLIASVWFLSGLIIMVLGIVGLYVGKTFEGVKQRPIYIVAERLNEPGTADLPTPATWARPQADSRVAVTV